MKVFRDLYVRADGATMATAVTEIEKSLPYGWMRDSEAERRARAFPVATKRIAYCFSCKQEQRRPAAVLILAQKDPDTFYVSNIIPAGRHQLESTEYNDVLESFYVQVFKPYADEANLEYNLTEAEADLEQWLDEPTAKLLRTFSACANKGTGASHPDDRERWNAFLLSAHKAEKSLDPSTLARWLVEAEGWSPEIAEELALEYESGLGLLAYASNH